MSGEEKNGFCATMQNDREPPLDPVGARSPYRIPGDAINLSDVIQYCSFSEFCRIQRKFNESFRRFIRIGVDAAC